MSGGEKFYIWFDPQTRVLTFRFISGFLKKTFDEYSELMSCALALSEEGYKIT